MLSLVFTLVLNPSVCPYFCTFCDQAGTGARRRSPQKVIDEIKDCVEKYVIK